MTQCTLCELPADPPVTEESVDGTFCCQGCLEVYRSLGDVDVDQQTAVREALDDDERPTEYDTEQTDTAYLAVEGMHCSTCEVFLESVACDQSGVVDADASYAAETIKMVYDPTETDETSLTDAVSGMGYTARARGEEADAGTDLASRLLVGGLFGMMAMTWYALFLYPTYFGFDPVVTLGQFDGAYLYAQLAVVTGIILLYTGQPMLRGAYVSIRSRRPNVDLLVSVAALAAYLYSTGQILVGGAHLYYDVTIVVVMAVTIGNYYETRIKRSTAGLLADLTELQVESATLADGETVPVSEIEPGDTMLVKPGNRIPLDGTVVEGTAAVDEALVTGESLPDTKRPGDAVRGGTIVTDEPLLVEAGEDAESTLDRVVEMLWEIQATRPGAQRVADKIATVFVPLVLVVGSLVALLSLVTGSPVQTAMLRGLTVLIVSCPCALGLATPLAVATGLQSAADRGIVVATPALFEDARDVETVVFDKTGTLTTGEMTVTMVEAVDVDEGALLARAGAVEQYSDHPVADAIVEAATETEASTSPEEFERYPRGVAGRVGDSRVLVGHPGLFREHDWAVPAAVEQASQRLDEAGDVPVLVGWDGSANGVVGVGDSHRREWEAVLSQVGEDRRTVVLTGDEGASADRFRDYPAVDQVYAGVPPDGKAATIRRLSATETVAMVGDGSNDAPALAAADIGIALEGGAQLATDAADAVVLDAELENVPAVFDIAHRTNRRIKENIAWAFLYNGVAIPLAITGLLNPLFAAVAMATSSLFVVANSARRHSDPAQSKDDDTETTVHPGGDSSNQTAAPSPAS
jgi:Cu2+-exporting ATPase